MDRPKLTDPAQASERLLALGPAQLASIQDADLLAAWMATVAEFGDAASSARRDLDPTLADAVPLSPPNLHASLSALLAGYDRDSVERLIRRGSELRSSASPGSVLAVLAAGVPGLGLQPLLAALALRRPLLLKPATGAGRLSRAFLESLSGRIPRLAAGVAIASWSGGDRSIEQPLFERWSRIVAYGGSAAIADLNARVGNRLIAFGPRASVAIVGALEPEDTPAVTAGLARDVALFDQRGCLSVQAVYAVGHLDAGRFAAALAAALEAVAGPLPMRATTTELSGAQQVRGEAQMRGLRVAPPRVDRGTVILETDPGFLPSPGARTVRVHPVADGEELGRALARAHGRLQGVALAGRLDEGIREVLRQHGVARIAPPGELHSPPADWHNDGIDLLGALAT